MMAMGEMETQENTSESQSQTEELSSPAWLLRLANNVAVSVGGNELRHLITEPEMHAVPHAPKYCQRLIKWENRLLPLFDLASWLQSDAKPLTAMEDEDKKENMIIAVLGYNLGKSRVEYGALAVLEPPTPIDVKDSDACMLEETFFGKEAVIRSCFKKEGGDPVPIINLRSIFSGAFSSIT